MSKVLASRRLWTFVLTQLSAAAVLIINHYITDPFMQQMAGMEIGFVEGIGGILIAAYTVDDITSNVTAIKNGSHPNFPKQ